MNKRFPFLVRLALGLLFIFSGGQKLLAPTEEFLAVVETYELLPYFLNRIVAVLVPWVEFLLGGLLLIGLHTLIAAKGLFILLLSILLTLGQAMLRQLPIEECGCFGGGLSLPIQTVFLLDLFLLACLFWVIRHSKAASCYSLDTSTIISK